MKDDYYSANSRSVENHLSEEVRHKLPESVRAVLATGRYSDDASFVYDLPLAKGAGPYEIVLVFIEVVT